MNRVIIEKDKLQHNIEIIKNKVKDIRDDNGNSVKIIAVIKGNAYGMGMLLVAKKLIDNNIDFFAVSSIEEAKILRENGYNNKILLLKSTCLEHEVIDIVKYDLIATIGSKESCDVLNEIALRQNKHINVNIKIDTGFGRYGFIYKTATKEIIDAFKDKKNISVTGIYAHFSSSYNKEAKYTKEQFDRFLNVILELKKERFEVGILHICNSPAFLKFPEMYLNAVRIGSAFTGMSLYKEITGLQKVGYLESEVCEIKYLPKGYKIGYSETCKLKKDTKVALINAGYAEGIGVKGPIDSVRSIDKLRKLKTDILGFFNNEKMKVEINGRMYTILGRISMKSIVVDISGSDINIGDKVKININIKYVDSSIDRIEI